MRQYRGKRKDNGEWVYGWYSESSSGKIGYIRPVGGAWVVVDKSTVGQQTGLKDKNGKEDWIDDIVKTQVGWSVYYRRIFQAESGAYCINLPVLGATSGEDAIMLITCEHENVGDIHSNNER